MKSQPTETREALADDITAAQIEQLIAERKLDGTTSCKVVTENETRFLVCQWPLL